MRKITCLFLVLIFVIATLAACGDETKTPSTAETLEVAEQQLRDGEYAQAAVSFLSVIKIDNKKVRGYTGAADAYIGLGDIPSAAAILQKGLEALPANEQIVKKQAEIAASAPSQTPSVPGETTTAPPEVTTAAPPVTTAAPVTVKPPVEIVPPDNFVNENYAPHATVKAKGGLRMRTGPGGKYDVIIVIPDNTSIIESGYDNGQYEWIYVKYKDKYGWVSSQYLEYEGGMAKPVIYLYPKKTTDISVKVDFTDGNFLCTYPEYNSGWNVTAHPDGKIINKADGLEYSYLFWDGEANVKYDMSKGFVVKGADTAAFFREKLAFLGLTPKEYNEFIVYWLPLMQNNPYNYISFQEEIYTNAAKLTVSPKPDTIIRVFMVYKPIEKEISVTEQVLKPTVRKGFTVVEWGGTEYN